MGQQEQNEKKKADRSCNISPSNSSLSSSSSNLPQSNEDTDSASRISESIQSSTPENGKDENNSNKDSNPNSGNESNSSKDDKTGHAKNDGILFSAKSSNNNSEENSENSSSNTKQYSSLESGISSMMEIETTGCSTVASECNQSEKTKNYKGGKLGRKRKRGYIYNPKP